MIGINRPGLCPRIKSFSLIEILVTITVIAILVAILLPALRSARERAKRIKCASNEHQILLGLNYYSEDHEGYLPQQAQYSGNFLPWSSYLTNYFKNAVEVFRCPSDMNARRFPTEPYRSYAVNGQSFYLGVYNCPWPTPEEPKPWKMADVPNHVILLGENHGIDNGTPPGVSGATVQRSELEGLKGVASANHRDVGLSGIASEFNSNGGGNYGFPDGHVEFHKCVDYLNPNPAFAGGANDPWKWL